VNEAALRAARQGKEAVDMTDFDEAIDRVVAGLERIEAEVVDREALLAVMAASETPRPSPDGSGRATASS
jgi:ATP-dependent Zn protease